MSQDKLDLILKKLEDLETRISKIEASCSNMDSHISFIERAYISIRGYFGGLLPYGGNAADANSKNIGLLKQPIK